MPPIHPAPLRAFVARFNRGEYWACHESLERGWLRNRSPFYHGLILYASALVHLHRRNAHGVVAQLDKALPLLRRYRPRYLGIDVGELTRHGRTLRRRIAANPTHLAAALEIPPPVLTLGPVSGKETELRKTLNPGRSVGTLGRREPRGIKAKPRRS